MGYNIGIRIIEDFLARTNAGRCYDFRDTAEKVQVCTPCLALGFVFIIIQQIPVTVFLIEINTGFFVYAYCLCASIKYTCPTALSYNITL